MGGEGAKTPTRAELFRDLAEAAEGIADALESKDDILGLLSSRAFVYAAYDLGEDFWTDAVMSDFPGIREERRDEAIEALGAVTEPGAGAPVLADMPPTKGMGSSDA